MLPALTRRAMVAALASASALSAPVVASPHLRGDDTERLPDHADLWARMPLPFTPAEAWHLLSPATQAEIGAAVIGMALAEYVAGDGREDEDQFHDEELRGAAIDTQHDLLNAITPRLWALLPDLYGPDGDHPAWALDSGMAARLPTA
ncbi:hypothetical protein ASG52_24620 [Methylobacterium sp. Leaf456]|uniref:hypothetical protein n=1 Tax=Methylobacterium sp. Leaf456 TaxID=1736382 RepID=UPI0006F314D9|nr:hypothetical protein [Methylobacterium sp. Leaf456]KQT56105.1 hypothetical protein ASG52_24620 [Methylobacterium sp. Leaf456]